MNMMPTNAVETLSFDDCSINDRHDRLRWSINIEYLGRTKKGKISLKRNFYK